MEGGGGGSQGVQCTLAGSHTRAAGASTPHDESLRIDHGEGEALHLAELRLVRDRAGMRTELWRFPALIDQEPWWLDPGESIILSSGRGANTYYARTDARPTFWLYVQGEAFLWEARDSCWIEDGEGQRVSNVFAF